MNTEERNSWQDWLRDSWKTRGVDSFCKNRFKLLVSQKTRSIFFLNKCEPLPKSLHSKGYNAIYRLKEKGEDKPTTYIEWTIPKWSTVDA